MIRAMAKEEDKMACSLSKMGGRESEIKSAKPRKSK